MLDFSHRYSEAFNLGVIEGEYKNPENFERGVGIKEVMMFGGGVPNPSRWIVTGEAPSPRCIPIRFPRRRQARQPLVN